MKREGYEAGTGASRKRKSTTSTAAAGASTALTTNQQNASEDDQDDNPSDSGNQGPSSIQDNEASADGALKAKNPRANRFHKSIQQQEQRQKQQEQFRQQAQVREQEKEQALKRRRQRHKLLTARTTKGQPVMKNIVQDILIQLQAEKDAKATNEKHGH